MEKPDFGISKSQDFIDILLRYRWIFTNQLSASFTKLFGEMEYKIYLGLNSRVMKDDIAGNRQNELPIYLLISEGPREINSTSPCFSLLGPWYTSYHYALSFIPNQAVDSLVCLFFVFCSEDRNKSTDDSTSGA